MPGLQVAIYEDTTKSEICSYYGKTLKDLKEYTNELREWVKNQPHLPKDISEYTKVY